MHAYIEMMKCMQQFDYISIVVLFLKIVGKALSEPYDIWSYVCWIFVGTLDILHDLNRTPTQCIQLERDKLWQYLIFLLKI